MLLLHGIDDDTVYPSNSHELAEAPRDVGAPVEIRFHEGVDHIEIIGAFSPPLRSQASVLEDTAA